MISTEQTYSVSENVRHAIADIVNYNYASEEADAVREGMEGDPAHIFTSIECVNAWLIANAVR